MPIKVLGADGSGGAPAIADGIRYAADHGANVISMSFVLSGPDANVESALQYAHSRGVILVAAAGNAGGDAPTYPASYPDVISVAAVDQSGALFPWSTHGTWVTLAAPGCSLTTAPRRIVRHLLRHLGRGPARRRARRARALVGRRVGRRGRGRARADRRAASRLGRERARRRARPAPARSSSLSRSSPNDGGPARAGPPFHVVSSVSRLPVRRAPPSPSGPTEPASGSGREPACWSRQSG